MDENEVLVLSDKQINPTDEYIFSIIGEKRIYWQDIMKNAFENYKDISCSWKYYNDGKQWLFKLVQKKANCLRQLKMVLRQLKDMVR